MPEAMTRMTFRLKRKTLRDLKDIEARKPKELKRLMSERVRLVVEDYVESSRKTVK